MPFVNDDSGEALEVLLEVVVGEEEREAFRSGDEAEGELLAEFGFLVGRAVAGAHAHFEGEVQFLKRFLERFLCVQGEGAERSNPEDATTARLSLFNGFGHRPEPDGESLSQPGWCVQEAGFSVVISLPGFPLEGKRPPPSVLEEWHDRRGGRHALLLVQDGIFEMERNGFRNH